jgi:predicted DCC family thiol-disulfide oxidoreductase YuxK
MTVQNSFTLLYDGDCNICQEWVDYWQQLTGDAVVYRPYQQAGSEFPDIPVEDTAAAIYLIDADGNIRQGAAAAYHLYQVKRPRSVLPLLYRYLPGFAWASELAYLFFSRHRGLLAWITHLFWGRNFEPPRFEIISWMFLRLLGCIYLVAFLSFLPQGMHLIGSDGVMPLQSYLGNAMDQLGQQAIVRLPGLFWLADDDLVINGLCIFGIVLSLSLIAGFLVRTSLVLLYVIYLSLMHGGQIFMSFQWDLLLLECGFLAIFLPWGSRLIIWLYRWLVFRFMFLGGVVKLMSGDPTWDNLTALSYHFETQPLPTQLAWYAHHLPESVLMSITALTLFIELALPFLIFTPRRFRHLAAWSFLALQFGILLTGNYNFFNILTMAICLFLFDDAAVKKLLPQRLYSMSFINTLALPGRLAITSALLMAITGFYVGGTQVIRATSDDRSSELPALYRLIYPFGIVNSYGPFAIMTTVRREIVIEGSMDGDNWQEYHFKYKPDDLTQCPGWVTPHQPRVDWQMWFAALSSPDRQYWFQNLLVRLLLNSDPISDLFEFNPFPEDAPMSVRALYYEYSFTSKEERQVSGQCWNRKLLGEYYPAISLNISVEQL